MRHRILGSLACLLAGALAVLAQPPAPPKAAPDTAPAPPMQAPEAAPAPATPPAAAPADHASPRPPFAEGWTLPFLGENQAAPVAAEGGPAPDQLGSAGGHVFGGAEFLWWALKKTRPLPSLFLGTVVRNAEGDKDHNSNGAFGETGLDYGPFFGGRFGLGYWLDDCRGTGVEARFLFLAQNAVNYRNVDAPFLARSFVDLGNDSEAFFPVSVPGVAGGNLLASSQSRLWGAEVNVWKNLVRESPTDPLVRVDALAGLRYLDLAEDVRISSLTSFLSNFNPMDPVTPAQAAGFIPLAGNQVQINDAFQTRNHFYGGQVGLQVTIFGDFASLELGTKLALGTTEERLAITGSQVRTAPGTAATVADAGLLALPSNIGHFRHNKPAFVPEETFNLVVPVTCHVKVNAGYTFLYWNKVIRAGEQIDRGVDVTQIPNYPIPATPLGIGRPGPLFTQSHVWAQGVNFSVEFSW